MHEFKLYAPRSICTQLKWKDLFLDLYGCRHLYQKIEGKKPRVEEELTPLLKEIIHGHKKDPVLQPIKRSKNLFQVHSKSIHQFSCTIEQNFESACIAIGCCCRASTAYSEVGNPRGHSQLSADGSPASSKAPTHSVSTRMLYVRSSTNPLGFLRSDQ